MIAALAVSAALGFAPLNSRVAPMQPRAASVVMSADATRAQAAAGLAVALALASTQAAVAGPFTRSDIASLTYEQIKGTGLANTCPKVEAPTDAAITLSGGKKYKIDEFCLEPTSFSVLEEKMTKSGLVTEAVPTKVTTRQTYVLTGIEGDLVQDAGKLKFVEKDGIDYAPTTVQLPGGERVPFLFTVKSLVASSDTSDIKSGTKFSGKFQVPSYRTGLFLDPKGRGTTTGYDNAVALPALLAGDDSALFKENNKVFDVGAGSLELKVTSVNAELGEFGGVFVQKQPSDTDLGSKAPKEVLLKGEFFATVQ